MIVVLIFASVPLIWAFYQAFTGLFLGYAWGLDPDVSSEVLGQKAFYFGFVWLILGLVLMSAAASRTLASA